MFEPGSCWSPSTRVIFPRFHLGRPVGSLAQGDDYDDDDDYDKHSSVDS